MRVNQAFRFELAPNVAPRIALAKHVGAARFAYNWGLARCREALAQGRRLPSAVDLHKEWNRWKRANAPWWAEVSKCAPQEAFRDLERAFRNGRSGRADPPRFKRKKSLDDNKARLTGAIRVDPRHVQLPRIGKVRTKERTEKLLALLQAGKARILSATIAREADRWYVSLTCEVERPDPPPREGEPVGVDLGLTSFLALSDGTTVEAPKPLARALRLLRRRSRELSRKQQGSRNARRAALRLARLHRRVRNIRADFLHQVTTWLAKTKPAVVVEDLNVRGLARGPLSRSVADVGWGAFRRMLEYKARWYGSRVIVAPRDFPSTRRCSGCGRVAPRMPLSERVFRCGACGLELNRDLNAALNLQSYGLAARKGPTASSAGTWGPRAIQRIAR
ncbi:RNA-guided endonuclease InsQ/TnpB family protein, partial [Thermoflexus sp.]|uniref:RNA-guided endonuclease InsQ/TnpB family protein n=1 Tax=Thermoflexus sp. TaxID=1969742 RepID=UPI0035E3FEBE